MAREPRELLTLAKSRHRHANLDAPFQNHRKQELAVTLSRKHDDAFKIGFGVTEPGTQLEPLTKDTFLPISLECPSTPNGHLVARHRNVENHDQIITVRFKMAAPDVFVLEFIDKVGSPHKVYKSLANSDKDELFNAVKERINPIYKRICLGDGQHKQSYKMFMQENRRRVASGMIAKGFFDPSKD